MATPLTQRQKDGLDPLTSGGALAGTGDGSFSGAATSAGFTNAQDLLAANKGKGQEMFNAIPGSSAQDESDAVSGINELKGYDPKTGLSSSTSWEDAGQNKSVGADGMTRTDVMKTPTVSTAYNGWTGDEVQGKADKLRGLKSKFDGFQGLYGQQDGATELRGQAMAQNIQKSQPLYAGNKGQGAFDSFLVESEAAPSIQANSDRIKGLMGKFDGFDGTVDGLKSGIKSAQDQVGSVKGPAQVTDSWSSKLDPVAVAMENKSVSPATAGVIGNVAIPQSGGVRPQVNNIPLTQQEKDEEARWRVLKSGAGSKDASGNTISQQTARR